MDAARLIPPGLIPPGLIQTGLLTRANPMVDRNRVVHCRHPAGPEDIHSLLIIAEGRLSDPLPDTIHHITSKDLALIRGLPAKGHQSLTPNDIIDHYVTDAQRGVPLQDKRGPPAPPPPHHNAAIGGLDGHRGGSRPVGSPISPHGPIPQHARPGAPRPGGGMDPRGMPRTPELGQSDGQFGPGLSPNSRGMYGSEQGGLPGRHSPRSPMHNAGPELDERGMRSPARYAGGSPGALGTPQRLPPDSHPQQRGMMPTSPQYSHGGNLRVGASPGGPGSRTPSPQSSPHYAMARTGGPLPPQHGGAMGPPPGSFSRPLRPGAQSPPEPRYEPGTGSGQDPRKLAQQFQGHAF
ncbi:Protein SKG3 [Ophiocordyceps camponoti-floridani]|uniref:Protein SKG3 n=1 Tax=Ophiocordyceps camponoti-floridani TaxID=2030778 RepID=A0A8H4QBU4_9HYPO|nr:Protein SKG3 [Ophiocordyceps camponoti-floridani]